ncbi:MAG: putative DNA binding domain-containing protein [Flavobacteriales bacterium]|nr:putative DNA binding domain-containing protein [Flavobacteriales bacterium]NUQ15888.1 putative DNA binding domain-containing protein [Flavobacteriales bacterium]
MLHGLLDRMRSFGKEKDWFEFKVNNVDPHKLGENLSAVANAACLAHEHYGYVVYGIHNNDLAIAGTSVFLEKEKVGSQSLVLWLAKLLSPDPGLQHFVVDRDGKRILIIQVRAALGQPVKFKGKAYVRIDSSTTALADHPLKERAIWNSGEDWSAKVHPTASLLDLDEGAIAEARRQYAEKHPEKVEELGNWRDGAFLDKAKVTIQGGITHAALLLLGKPESATLLNPAIGQISWFLRTDRNESLDYMHFGPPFILNVDRVLSQVRNLKVRSLPSGTLFPVERDRYDNWVMREALHNCIAHQDYMRRERILVIERESSLSFENAGGFIPDSVEAVVKNDRPPSYYRNPFLAQAMVNLNMIDTEGGGIRRMYQKQRERAFALPDYDLSAPDRVAVRLEGAIIDEVYTRLLLDRTDLDLETVLLLDKVQRRRGISKAEHKLLKGMGLVEGRYPHLIVSGKLARIVGEEPRHIRNKGLGNEKIRDFIVRLVMEHPGVSRQKIDELVLDMLPDLLDIRTRKSRVHNQIQRLVKEGRIHNRGGRGTSSNWFIGPIEKTNSNLHSPNDKTVN